MEGQVQTSFIPKRPLVQKTGSSHQANLLLRILIAIFVIVILLAGGMFGYSYYLQQNITQLQGQLSSDIQKLQPAFVKNVQDLSTRITTTKSLLQQHTALSGFFGLLNRGTVVSVRFSSFKYTYSSQKIIVSMGGVAHSFSDIAAQAAEFSKPEYQTYFANPVFSNLGLDQSGNVTFTFTADINPTAFLYVNKFSATPTQTQMPAAVSGSVASTTVATSTAATTTTKTATTKTTTKTSH